MNDQRELDRSELDSFKKSINLADFIESFGYEVDRKDSYPGTTVLRSGDAKLVVTFGRNGQWLFKDCRSGVHGSIVDFVSRETGDSLGQCRQRLRTWAHTEKPVHQEEPSSQQARLSNEDAAKKVKAVWTAARATANNAYLQARGLSEATLNDPRFKDRHRLSSRGATLFPHFDKQGMCGYEVRGVNLKSFGRGTRKGLWYGKDLVKAPAIVVCESVIDCMSHAQLNPSLGYGYASFAGEIGNAQRDLLTSLLHKAAQRDVRVIVATDNDAKGEDYFEALSLLSPCSLARWTPTCKDWNCDLIQSLKAQ